MCYIITNAYLLILLLHKNCYAKIEFNITVASSRGGISVSFNGSDTKNITDSEINAFNIGDVNIKRGVKVEFGRTPDDVYLKDPTPYGYLYQKYNWSEVKRNLTVKSVRISEIINEQVVVIKHNHINNTSKTIRVPVNIYESVENTLKSWWSKEGLPNDDIFYKTNIDFDVKRIAFVNKWRNESRKVVTLPFGLRNPGYINIHPGKVATIQLNAKKTILLFKIKYVAYLMGNIIANYGRLLGKYHFWAPSISSIMKAAELSNKLITTEMMEIKCYTDPAVDVLDKSSGESMPIIFASRQSRGRKIKHHKKKT